MEFDVMSESADGRSLLVGEVKRRVSHGDVARLEDALRKKARRLPFADKYTAIVPQIFAASCSTITPATHVLTAADVLPSLT